MEEGKMPTPEEIRAQSDAELIKGGANLELTEEQVKEAENEMNSDLGSIRGMVEEEYYDELSETQRRDVEKARDELKQMDLETLNEFIQDLATSDRETEKMLKLKMSEMKKEEIAEEKKAIEELFEENDGIYEKIQELEAKQILNLHKHIDFFEEQDEVTQRAIISVMATEGVVDFVEAFKIQEKNRKTDNLKLMVDEKSRLVSRKK